MKPKWIKRSSSFFFLEAHAASFYACLRWAYRLRRPDGAQADHQARPCPPPSVQVQAPCFQVAFGLGSMHAKEWRSLPATNNPNHDDARSPVATAQQPARARTFLARSNPPGQRRRHCRMPTASSELARGEVTRACSGVGACAARPTPFGGEPECFVPGRWSVGGRSLRWEGSRGFMHGGQKADLTPHTDAPSH
jgi:hypothetical protein